MKKKETDSTAEVKMRILDLKPGQKVKADGKIYEYKGVNKVLIPGIGKAQKFMFKGEEKLDFKLYNLTEGSRTLLQEKMELID